MKRLLVVLLTILLLVLGAGGWWWLRLPLPGLDGELGIAGLRGPVEVVFDGYAVPHVYARDPDDAWFSAGVLHARERLWQMELYRRVTAGRLSEVLGEPTLPIDKRFLTLNLRAAAEAEWARARPEVKTALERYAEGVNAVIARLQPRQRPIEMQLLGLTPAPWTPVDTLSVGRLLAWRLAENHQSELVRAAVAQKLGPEVARQLAGRYPSEAPTVLDSTGDPIHAPVEGAAPVSGGAIALPPPTAMRRGDTDASSATVAQRTERSQPAWPAGLEWLHPGAKRGNSNNWVLAGSRTSSGRPLLANDPHLLVEFPSVWYEMHLVAAGLDVIGVTIPGVPFVVIGHNRRVAWGFTNSGADVQDLTLERIDVARKRYMGGGAWHAAKVTRVDIPVRGRATPEPFDVWQTGSGTIFSEAGLEWESPPAWMTPGTGEAPAAQVTAFALHWAGLDGDTASSFELLNRAQDWTTFVAGIDTFDTPSQNIVYADVDGNIGYALSGRLPVRSGGDGTMPLSGSAGWIEAGGAPRLPRVLNPKAGYITSSNNEIDRGGNLLITRDWAAEFRAVRLHEALASARGVGLEEMARLQNDVKSVAAARIVAGIAPALETAKKQGAELEAIETLTELAAWDQVVDGRPVVTLYQAFEDALWRRTFADEMGDPLFRAFYEWAGAERPAGLHVIVDERQSRWFDDIATIEKRESRDDIYILAARDAAEHLDAEYGSGSGRAWDRVHAVTFEHPLASGSWWRSWVFSRGPVPITGDGTTVMRVSWNRSRPFRAWEAPSWRQIFDVGEWDQARVVLPAGQSGHLMSPHYFDQNELWRTGQYRTQPFSREAVVKAQQHRLVLTP